MGSAPVGIMAAMIGVVARVVYYYGHQHEHCKSFVERTTEVHPTFRTI